MGTTRWEIYFYLIVLQLIVMAIVIVISGHLLVPIPLLHFLFALCGLTGLFCYVFGKEIGKNIFWRVFLPVFIVWDVFFICYWIPRFTESGYNTEMWITNAFLFLFLFPQYLGIFRYAYNK